MCDVATIGLITTIASTTFSIAQASQQAKEKKAVAAYNSRVSENAAQDKRTEATEAENIQRTKTARLLAKQQAQLGAANIDLTSGSALQLQEDTVALGEADALRIRRSGDSRFDALMQESELETAKGEFAETQGKFDVAGSLLTGTGDIIGSGVADKWFTDDSAAKTG